MRPRRGRGPGPGGGAWGCQSRARRRRRRGSLHVVAPVAAGAADRRPSPRHPEPPPAVPARRAGKAGCAAEPSRPPTRQRSAARAPPPGCVSAAAPLASRGRSRGAGRPSSPSPPHLRAPRLQPGPRAAPPHPGVGLVPSTPISGRLHNRWGWGQGPLPSLGPTPVPVPRSQAEGRQPARQGGPGKFHFVVRVC